MSNARRTPRCSPHPAFGHLLPKEKGRRTLRKEKEITLFPEKLMDHGFASGLSQFNFRVVCHWLRQCKSRLSLELRCTGKASATLIFKHDKPLDVRRDMSDNSRIRGESTNDSQEHKQHDDLYKQADPNVYSETNWQAAQQKRCSSDG